MPAISSFGPTGNAYLDGLLMGNKWAVSSFTYSFPTQGSFYGTPYAFGENTNNFEAFNETQKDCVRFFLNTMLSEFVNLTFTEIEETASVHADLRFAKTDRWSTAVSYFPSTSAIGGDCWFNNSQGNYDNPLVGTYAWFTIIHEIGHGLGLKHPHETHGSFGALPSDRNAVFYTVMSYRSYIGGPDTAYSVPQNNYPQSAMLYDIQALQHLYGPNTSIRTGNNEYKMFSATGILEIDDVQNAPTPVANKVLRVLPWDAGGTDVLDLSNYAAEPSVTISEGGVVAPGSWITLSTTQLCAAGGGQNAPGCLAIPFRYQGSTASDIESWLPAGLDIVGPSIISMGVISDSGENGVYGIGDTISFGVTFHEPVLVTGTPQLTVNVGGSNKVLNLSSGGGTSQLIFNYVVQSGDNDTNGVSIAANSLSANGGTLEDASDNVAIITHSAISDISNHKVDGTAPTATSLFPADNSTGVSTLTDLVITFNERMLAGNTATVSIKKTSDNSIVETFDETAFGISMFVEENKLIIDPTSELDYSTEYYVQVGSGSVVDFAGNNYAGISSTTGWSFTTTSAPAKVISNFRF